MKVHHRIHVLLSASFLLLISTHLLSCATVDKQASPKELLSPTTQPAFDPEKVEALVFNEADDNFSFVDGVSGVQLTFAQVQARALQSDAILVGEQHDQSSHHRLQARIIDALKGLPLSVGFEMVDWRHKKELAQLRANEIDLDGFFAAVKWEDSWGRQSPAYRSVFESALSANALLLALNCPREVVRSVSRGGLESLSDEDRARLPKLDLENVEHKARISAVFNRHHPTAGREAAFERFYTAQVIWDELMAKGAATGMNEGRKVVVIAGVGHVATPHAIKGRLLRRKPQAKIMQVVPMTLEHDEDPREVIAEAISDQAGTVLAIRRARKTIDL